MIETENETERTLKDMGIWDLGTQNKAKST